MVRHFGGLGQVQLFWPGGSNKLGSARRLALNGLVQLSVKQRLGRNPVLHTSRGRDSKRVADPFGPRVRVAVAVLPSAHAQRTKKPLAAFAALAWLFGASGQAALQVVSRGVLLAAMLFWYRNCLVAIACGAEPKSADVKE